MSCKMYINIIEKTLERHRNKELPGYHSFKTVCERGKFSSEYICLSFLSSFLLLFQFLFFNVQLSDLNYFEVYYSFLTK